MGEWPEGAEEMIVPENMGEMESIPDGMLDDMTMKKRQKDKPEDIDWGDGKKKAPVSLFGDEPEPEEQPRRKKISLKKTQEESKIKVDVDEGLLARLKKPVKVEIPEIPPEEPVEEEIVAPEEAATVEAALPSFLPPEEKKKKGPVNLFG